MRVTLHEAGLLYARVLQALGVPKGAVRAAVRMALWADIYHGLGATFMYRRYREGSIAGQAKPRILRDSPDATVVDGNGLSSLLVGPAILDLATAKANAAGQGLMTGTGMTDLLWFGQLAQQASRRGLVCALSFQASAEQAEVADLAELYSTGRGIVALPSIGRSLWIEVPSPPLSHNLLMDSGSIFHFESLPERTLVRAGPGSSGFTLALWRLERPELEALGRELLERAAINEAQIFDQRRVRRRALSKGLEVEEDLYRRLLEISLNTLAPSSETERSTARDG
ncbi:MAG: Ldh family oxidoreductase [Kiloniellales bacterium]|nr:Ldh family oxidoreductase [Kiloniellales bacterium]